MTRFLKIISLKWHKKSITTFIALAIAVSMGQDCSKNPCMYGICVDDPTSSYRCYCIDGYTGSDCEINWDDCWSNPCLNGGTCNDAIASYNCTCTEGFVGLTCEQRYSECMSHPCLNNGTCLDYNGFTCQCLEGFSGEVCEIDVSVCNNTICKNFGECVEGPGLSFMCQCLEGWTGKYCEEDINECIALPCQNGGLCINAPGSYTCACLFGFTGKDCDKKVIPCRNNPCQNNAVCLFEDAQPVCYCVPDYHGVHCELRYNDCESKYAHCENGGTCVDGINNFTCSCLSKFTGDKCSIPVDTQTEVSTFSSGIYTTKLPNVLNTTTSSHTFKDILDTDILETTFTTEEVEINTIQNISRTADTSNFTETKEFFTIPIDSHTENDLNQFIPSRPDYTTIEETSYISGIQDFTSTTADETNIFVGYTTETIREVQPMQTPDNGILTTTTELTSSNDSLEQSSVLSDLLTTGIKTSTEINKIPKMTGVTNDNIFTSTLSSEMSIFTNLFESSMTSATLTTIVSSTKAPVDADYDETMTDDSLMFTISAKARPDESTTITQIRSTASSSTLSDTTKYRFDHSFPSSTTIAQDETLNTVANKLDFTTVTDLYKRTFGMEIDRTEVINTSTTPEYRIVHSCTSDQCANTSHCLYNATECDCSYQNNCKQSPNINNAAFNGQSYIRQKFSMENGSLNILSKLKTQAKSGILIHSLFDDERYILLYMETGQLKFQFSCGLQTMLFGELDSPINNGYDVDIEMRFQYIVEQNSDKCLARLIVNGTIAMSGEQVLQTHESIPQFARLHVGGIPVSLSHQFPQIVLGFVGCMSLLKVNNKRRDFIHDSLEAVQIEECNSFLCLSNPCKNFGECQEVSGKINCKCFAGYSGKTCERSICDDNPCHLGATCLSSPGVNFICICPLGTHGLYCEKDTTVLQPSFSVFSPGFSSYMAYGVINSLKDNMELKLRIIPQTLEQISLIAYMGQAGSKRESSDHFSITYVRGYVMLTWDLGSGVRRIFTNTPLNLRTHKVHTVYVGRRGRNSWLYVDGIGNVTGRAAGTNTKMDVSPILYIGGHKSKYFEALPHDLPLHSGFAGCIYDIELRTDNNVFPVTMSSPATGRGVGECHHNECSHHLCKNGAVCLSQGPTYSCICMKDWEGPDCSTPVNCTFSNPLCHNNHKITS